MFFILFIDLSHPIPGWIWDGPASRLGLPIQPRTRKWSSGERPSISHHHPAVR